MGKTPNPGGANSGMAEPGADPFEGQRVDEPIFLEVLEPAIDALEAAGVPYGIMGGLASASLGVPGATRCALTVVCTFGCTSTRKLSAATPHGVANPT